MKADMIHFNIYYERFILVERLNIAYLSFISTYKLNSSVMFLQILYLCIKLAL